MQRSAIKERIRRALSVIPPLARQFGRSDRLAYFERFCPLGHYYSPIADVAALQQKEEKLFGQPPDVLPGIDLRLQNHRELIRSFAAFASAAPWKEHEVPGLRYHFDNTLFMRADALTLYSMLRHLRPRRLIEVGSGWSSCVSLDTIDRHLGGQREVRCIFIDPDPSRLQNRMLPGDQSTIEIRSAQVQDVNPDVFQQLQPGDVLFIDSSHVAKSGSDVNYLYFEVLPKIKPGVYVHIHDIFYPFEYPKKWIYDGRSWNEAYLVRAMLTLNASFEIVWFGDYAARFLRNDMEQMIPDFLDSPAQSLWIQRI